MAAVLVKDAILKTTKKKQKKKNVKYKNKNEHISRHFLKRGLRSYEDLKRTNETILMGCWRNLLFKKRLTDTVSTA